MMYLINLICLCKKQTVLFVLAVIMFFAGNAFPVNLFDPVPKEVVIRDYVKGKTYSKYPGVTQIRLGKKVKGYSLAALYTGSLAFFTAYVGSNAYNNYLNVNRSNDVCDEIEKLQMDYDNNLITYNQYDRQYDSLSVEFHLYRKRSISNRNRAFLGLGITVVSITALHLFDYFDSRKEFNKFFDRNKDKFNVTFNPQNFIITTSAKFSF